METERLGILLLMGSRVGFRAGFYRVILIYIHGRSTEYEGPSTSWSVNEVRWDILSSSLAMALKIDRTIYTQYKSTRPKKEPKR